MIDKKPNTIKRKKYLLIGDGESVHIVKWAKILTKYFDLYLISFQGFHTDLFEIIKEQNRTSFNISLNSNGGNVVVLKKIWAVLKIINNWKQDIVNAHYISSSGFLAAIAKKLSLHHFTLIQSAWGSDILVSPKKNYFYILITKFALNSSEIITSDSEFMSAEIRKLSTKKICTFTFGIENLPDVDASSKNVNLYFSNRGLSQTYRIDKIIDFFAKIKAKNNKAKLIISNDGNMRGMLEKQVVKLDLQDDVSFLGFINQNSQNEIYEKSQFFLSLPDSDSTSVSLIEAMSYGCIPLLSDLPANKEWIQNWQNGLIEPFEPKDLEQMLIHRKEIFDFNRNLINEKGIFSNSIYKFLKDNRLL